jgi:hypothetical protein
VSTTAQTSRPAIQSEPSNLHWTSNADCIWDKRLVRAAFYRLPLHWRVKIQRWCILFSTLRSFRGHIAVLRAKKRMSVDAGPAFESASNGLCVWDKQTLGRIQGIQRLEAKHPWASIVDREIFLMGFDTGVECLRHTDLRNESLASNRTLATSPPQPSSPSSGAEETLPSIEGGTHHSNE